MKNKSNKRVVDAVRNLVVGAASEAALIKRGGAKLLANAAEKWKATKPGREKIAIAADAAIAKTVQMKDDIKAGFRQGIKAAQKESKKQ